MGTRWVLCPVVTIQTDNGIYRAPKVALFVDPGKPPRSDVDEETGLAVSHGRGYNRSSVIGAFDWCVCYVRGSDWTPLDQDAEIVTLVQDGEPLDASPKSLGWTAQRLDQLKQTIDAKRGNVQALAQSSPLYEFIVALGQRIRPDFVTTRGTWVGESKD